MQRLRILSPLALALCAGLLAGCGQPAETDATPAAEPKSQGTAQPKAAPAAQTKPAATAAAKPAAKPADAAKPAADPAKPKPKKMKVGEVLDFNEALPQVLPEAGSVSVAPRQDRPMLILFWGRNSKLSREALVELATFSRENELTERMDVYAIGSFKEGSQKPVDLREAALIEGVRDLTILADQGFGLSRRVGASQFPEMALFSKTGQLLVRGVRSLDHGRLGPQRTTASELIKLLAREGSFQPIPRTFPSYPGDRLIGRRFIDFELPRFHPDGWGKGLTERFSALRSGDRPTVLFFFSSTCKHCQIDVPQLVKYAAENPDLYDIVGITRIKHDRHRKVSEAYFKQQGIKFPILEDVGLVSELYRVSSTPTTYYISPGGRIGKATYYQHPDLEADYNKYYPALMGAPPPPPPAKERGWHFPMKLTDPSGKVIELASFQGKPTILHFWATWCQPCRKELPDLLRRLPELEREANVLMVSVDEDPAKVATYQKSSGLKFKSYHSLEGGLAEDVDFSRSVPRTYVLDAHGKLSKILAGSYDWDDPHRFAGVLGLVSQ